MVKFVGDVDAELTEKLAGFGDHVMDPVLDVPTGKLTGTLTLFEAFPTCEMVIVPT
jgi:hypothetical protein